MFTGGGAIGPIACTRTMRTSGKCKREYDIRGKIVGTRTKHIHIVFCTRGSCDKFRNFTGRVSIPGLCCNIAAQQALHDKLSPLSEHKQKLIYVCICQDNDTIHIALTYTHSSPPKSISHIFWHFDVVIRSLCRHHTTNARLHTTHTHADLAAGWESRESRCIRIFLLLNWPGVRRQCPQHYVHFRVHFIQTSQLVP